MPILTNFEFNIFLLLCVRITSYYIYFDTLENTKLQRYMRENKFLFFEKC